ncbi:MAG: VCBS repeat-containing protein, partial [Bacteroidota bacterium]
LVGVGYWLNCWFDKIVAQLRLRYYAHQRVFRYEATLAKSNWDSIQQYYLNAAPTSLPYEPMTLQNSLPSFKVKQPPMQLAPPSTTMVRMEKGQLFIGDAHTKTLYEFDESLALKNGAAAGEGVVHMEALQEGYVITSMGSFTPTDIGTGTTFFLPKSKKEKPFVMANQLRRPVHSAMADLDGDGKYDLITCEYGKWTGQLTWWKNDGNGQFERRLIWDMPGAIKAYPRDMNQDGRMDVVALFGQGDEGIYIFYNQGDGQFREQRIISFPPVYGSSFFELTDLNDDGHPDILYTNGDNADYTPITKPYHGIRLYENDGQNNFKEKLFLPLPGAYGAAAKDFDMDGDLDIAAISFFPDFGRQPAAGFVYFENNGSEGFTAQTFPGSTNGRWVVMDTADFDGDGDEDIALGNLAFEVPGDAERVAKWTERGLPFVVLENLVK